MPGGVGLYLRGLVRIGVKPDFESKFSVPLLILSSIPLLLPFESSPLGMGTGSRLESVSVMCDLSFVFSPAAPLEAASNKGDTSACNNFRKCPGKSGDHAATRVGKRDAKAPFAHFATPFVRKK